MNEKARLLKIPVKERTREQHLRLSKLFGGVRKYLLSMGMFKDDDELTQIVSEKIKKMKEKETKEKILDALEDKGKKISINPPPQNGKCECCGKHISKLKPFGKAGDPLVGDFDGVLLVKTFRSMAPKQEEFNISDCMNKDEYLDEEKFAKKYGKADLDRFYLLDQLENTVGASWECRDCIVLSDDEYFKRRKDERIKHKRKNN